VVDESENENEQKKLMARRKRGVELFRSRAGLFIYGKDGWLHRVAGDEGGRAAGANEPKSAFGQICKVSMCHVISNHAFGGHRPIITNSSLLWSIEGPISLSTFVSQVMAQGGILWGR
jgi:hypothetical protein